MLWAQSSPVFWHQDHEGNKFKHAGTEERRLGPGSWSNCSRKERKEHLDKSDGLGEDGGTEQQCRGAKPGAEQGWGPNLRKRTQMGGTGTRQAKTLSKKRQNWNKDEMQGNRQNDLHPPELLAFQDQE